MSDDRVLLRDLVEIPEAVHAGDFVLALAKGVGQKSTIDSYVVTPQLAQNFDRALDLIKSALENQASRAAYLDGSFGSGKSHFMAVLYAVLKGDPDARGKKGLADVVRKHDSWLRGRTFLLVPYHLPDSQSLDEAILGGYVAHVQKEFPGKPLPAVYRDDQLIDDAQELRQHTGDEGFIAQLPVGDAEAAEWGAAGWDSASLDKAFSEPPQGPERRRLVGDLLAGPFKRYARAVRGDRESFISLDEGLSVISKHAKDVLERDAIVLLLDELVLWLAGHIGDHNRISAEAQKVSKLIESAEYERPAPIISFVPRQRDLRDLVRKDAYGAETTSLFDTLKYWDGRFDSIRLDDRNLPAIIHERLLAPKNAQAKKALDAAFQKSTTVPAQTWEILLDTHGERGTKEDFNQTYPFSPAFTHAMVDISGALQRERTAIKLMQQLLVDYRGILPVGQLMPIGAIFDVLMQGADRPFTDKLREEFEQAKRFYEYKLRPYLLMRHGLTEDTAAGVSPVHAFRGADLVVKTLLLAALVPNVPALNGLTATRIAALNYGSIVSMLPNQQRQMVTATLKELSAQFGEIRLSGSADDPRVDLAIIGVDTEGIIRDALKVDDDAARRQLIRQLLWKALDIQDKGTLDTRTEVVWRGTTRTVQVVLDNVRDRERMPSAKFQPDPDAFLTVIDYPFDVGNYSPADDVNRVHELQAQIGDAPTLVWLPHFLSEDRVHDLSTLIAINYVLERDRLTEVTPHWTADDRHHARTQLESRRSALTARLTEALNRAYGVNSPTDADLGPRAAEQVMTLTRDFQPRLPIGQTIKGAFQRLNHALLDHRFSNHPDFDPNASQAPVKPAELNVVIGVVDQAAQDRVGRVEVSRGSVATLKKIANPLKLGVMHEAAFVLGHEWPDLINRKAAGQEEVKVSEIRGWIDDEIRGLPASVQNLVIICYAIQADKAWLRQGQPQSMPRTVGDVTDDMKLRGQELPSDEEFNVAAVRGRRIFGAGRQPVRSTRSVHALTQQVKDKARDFQQAAEALAAELDKHAKTLGLDEAQPRVATARTINALLSRLLSAPDSTATLRTLASADLPREDAIYAAHLDSADRLARELRSLNWPLLDEVAARAELEGQRDAVAVIDAMRTAARRDEHEEALAGPLRTADQSAQRLMIEWTRKPDLSTRDSRERFVDESRPADSSSAHSARRERIHARDVPDVLAKIAGDADANPDEEFEIVWRIIPR